MRAPVSSSHAGENARRHFDHRRLHPDLGGGGGDLEADQSAADHDQVLRCLQLRRQRARVGFGAQIVDTRHAERQQRDLAHDRAGGDHQRVIGQPPAGLGHHLPGGGVDRGATCLEFERDVVAGEPLRARDRRVLRERLAGEHRLRQRRFLVGLAGLVGEKDDRHRGILALRPDGGKDSGGAAADHDDGTGRAHVGAVLVAPQGI
jgi:hypothetical protein